VRRAGLARLRPLWSIGLCEDGEKHGDVAVVVGVAVDGDEVVDAVLGRERGVVSLRLAVVFGKPPDADPQYAASANASGVGAPDELPATVEAPFQLLTENEVCAPRGRMRYFRERKRVCLGGGTVPQIARGAGSATALVCSGS
jgi:hypothetical protein